MNESSPGKIAWLSCGVILVSAGTCWLWSFRNQQKFSQCSKCKCDCGKRLQIREEPQKTEEPSPISYDTAGMPLRLLKKAEAVLARRTARFIMVLERCTDSHNYTAVIRTAECLGVQHVWVIDPPVKSDEGCDGATKTTEKSMDSTEGSGSSQILDRKTKNKLARKKGRWAADRGDLARAPGYARRSGQWVTLRSFRTSAACLAALRADGRTIWATDLGQGARPLRPEAFFRGGGGGGGGGIPEKVAIVMGTESSGVSDLMLNAADKRIYIPLRGFSDSLNLSVSAAMIMQFLFWVCPEAEGDLDEGERAALRAAWYAQLARTPEQAALHARHLDSPPAPFDDLRRPPEHRTAFTTRRQRARDRAVVGGEVEGPSSAAAGEEEGGEEEKGEQ